jgi:hypothetical protein
MYEFFLCGVDLKTTLENPAPIAGKGFTRIKNAFSYRGRGFSSKIIAIPKWGR